MVRHPRKHRRRAPGLLLQIATALGVVGTVPLAVITFQLARVNRDALLEQLLRTHIVAAHTTADRIDSYLAVLRALATRLATDPPLAEAASPAGQRHLGDAVAVWSDAGVAAIAVYDAGGRTLAGARARAAPETIDPLLAGPPPRGPTLVRRGDSLWALVPAPMPEGRGTLLLIADAQPLARALLPELGDQARVVLLDASGEPLAIEQVSAPVLPQELREAARGGHSSGAGRFHPPGGIEIVGAWSAPNFAGWTVVSTQPAAAADAAARRMARRSALAVALALALTALLSFAAWRGLVRPLRALLAAQRQVAGLARAPAPGSETTALKEALDTIEEHARDRAALGSVFLGRYQVLEILGSGGMGTVFRGWDPRLQRAVALKTIHIGRRGEESSIGAVMGDILGEAMRAAQITHPNVVAVYDAEESGEVAYVAMELVDGFGLDRYLEERGRLEWSEVLPLGHALAEGLAAAHARGLVHRDVKPGNVLLSHDGAIKISDFGLATYVHKKIETPGRVFGTPGFLAPEVLRGEEYDVHADLYALGVLLFRAVLGRYPFRGTDFRSIVRSTVQDPTPTAEVLAGSMPEELAEVLAGLLAKNPAHRPFPTAELATRLEWMCRRRALTWRLDFARSRGEVDAREVFAPASLPTLQLDNDLRDLA